MIYNKGDLVKLGSNVNYLGLNDPEAYKKGKFTEGMVVGRDHERPEVIFINYRNDPTLFRGGIENMFADCDLEAIPEFERERIIEELINKDYKEILEERSIIE